MTVNVLPTCIHVHDIVGCATIKHLHAVTRCLPCVYCLLTTEQGVNICKMRCIHMYTCTVHVYTVYMYIVHTYTCF